MSKQKSKVKKSELKPGGKLSLEEVFNLNKAEKRAFIKAAREEEQQKKKDFQVGGIFEIGAAKMSLKSVRSMLNLRV